jgi:translation initiation factor 5B
MENNKPTSDVENPPTMKSPVTDKDGDDNGVEVVCPMPQQDDKVTELGSREKEGEGETVESAAAKKRRKKKEREKEKKAAAAAAGSAAVIETVEEKSETSEPKRIDSKTNKKVPKHVREMQELLARRKEDEERKKREEEERLRKEEEERQRLEELERLEEEAKRIKKEKEKQKLLKKKQEGKLLTDKQKQEARRLEAMRRQILNSIGGVSLPVVEDTGAPAKKPVYQTRTGRSTNRNHNCEASVKTDESREAKETITDLEEPSARMEDDVEPSEAVEEDVEDEWDERSWDDVNMNDRGAFADEEIVHVNSGEICILLIVLNLS